MGMEENNANECCVLIERVVFHFHPTVTLRIHNENLIEVGSDPHSLRGTVVCSGAVLGFHQLPGVLADRDGLEAYERKNGDREILVSIRKRGAAKPRKDMEETQIHITI